MDGNERRTMTAESGVKRRPLLGILTLAVSGLVGVSVLSSPPWPGAGPFPGLPPDACGTVGKFIASILLGALGVPLTFWGAMITIGVAVRSLFLRPEKPWLFFLWSGVTALVLSIFGAGLTGWEAWGEAPLATATALASPSAIGPVGSALATGALLLALLLIGIRHWVPRRVREQGERAALGSGRGVARLAGLLRNAGGAALARRPSRFGAERDDLEPRLPDIQPMPGAAPAGKPARSAKEPSPHADADGAEGRAVPARFAGAVDDEDGGLRAPAEGGRERPAADVRRASERASDRAAASKRGRAAAPPEEPEPSPPNEDGYVLPPVALLEPGEPPAPINQEELLETSRTLMRTLRDFGIQGQVGQVHPGPVVTQYEFEPAAGVRVSQIVSRAEDLALALRASRIRIVAPIPGKAAVGVEVPNRSAARISLRSVLDEVDLSRLPGELPLVLGRDIRGRPYATRLENMPHLLVAGTTGSGKSVFLNGLILSLLLRRTPDELRLLMIDPKMLELTPYDGIPHLACPVVTEAKTAARMLGWAVGEMERRYRRLAAVGARNLEGYRERVRSGRAATEGLEPMPHIVVFVDELADLMLTLANEIEGPIARLAQMARAVGIHLVLATQRPSVDVITGVIKANFPARIAFQVASKVDSRTILDANGAESLLGSGDMLFLPPGKAEAIRVHGAFVSEQDTTAVAEFLRRQPETPPLWRGDIIQKEEGEPQIGDELFEDALRLIVIQKQASVSFLQRRLKVGYSRAGRLMDLLEQAGAVGAQDGSKPREVLADERFLEQWMQGEAGRATHPIP
jgi:S-DNA-T family DNA segregation ATPase FtsK/SpoIIIE